MTRQQCQPLLNEVINSVPNRCSCLLQFATQVPPQSIRLAIYSMHLKQLTITCRRIKALALVLTAYLPTLSLPLMHVVLQGLNQPGEDSFKQQLHQMWCELYNRDGCDNMEGSAEASPHAADSQQQVQSSSWHSTRCVSCQVTHMQGCCCPSEQHLGYHFTAHVKRSMHVS